MSKFLNSVLVLSLSAGLNLDLIACPPNMEGGPKIAVQYIPSTNIESFDKYVKEHLNFIEEQMQNGTIQSAGPFLKGEDLVGGLAIYNLSDAGKVASIVQQDAVIKEKVFTFETHLWMQCSLKKNK